MENVFFRVVKTWLGVMLLLCSLGVQVSQAQTDTLFWFAVPDITPGGNDNSDDRDKPVFLRMAAFNQAAVVTISIPANNGFTPVSFTIPANTAYTYDLTNFLNLLEVTPANAVLNRGLKISSTQLISAYYDMQSGLVTNNRRNPETFALKGQNALGLDFYVPFQNFLDNGNSFTPLPKASFDIVATQDSTSIQITPTRDIVGHVANQTFTILLNKGQTWSGVASSQTGNQHPAGTHVVSNKPIAITMKDDLVSLEGCKDLMGDQIIPIEKIGKEYIVTKGALNNVESAFIVATQNNTRIYVNGSNNSVATINAGQTYTLGITSASYYIRANRPIYVMHMSGLGCELGAAILPSIKCTGSTAVSFVRNTSEPFAININVPAAAVNGFSLNGNTNAINASMFSNVPGTNGTWKYAQVYLNEILAPTGQASKLVNSIDKFHLGLFHGENAVGCNFGYFSDFDTPLNPVFNATDVACYGAGNGAVQLSVQNGTAPYTYSWSNGSTSANLTNLTPGSYSVLITDANGCEETGIVNISQPTRLVTTPSTVTAPLCNGQSNGSILMTTQGGTNPYSVSWNTGSTGTSLTNIPAGTYIATVTDARNCVDKDTIVLTQPAVLNATANQIQQVSCFGGNNASIQTLISGGTMPYTYLWNNGNTNANISGLAAGNYSLQVTDANGCQQTLQTTITQPAALQASNSSQIAGVSCFGGNNGNINLVMQGGTPNYSYQWNTGSTNANLSNLPAGNYTVVVTDSKQCSFTQSFNITQPALLTASQNTTTSTVSCFGGNNGGINLIMQGGVPNYSYQWSNGVTTPNNPNLPAGTYTVTVTDANQCSFTQPFTITQPSALQALQNSGSTPVSCYGGNNGSIQFGAQGGVPNYNYQWSNGVTTANNPNVPAGTYTVTVTDANQCSLTQQYVVGGPLSPLSLATQSTQITQADCFGANTGSIQVAAQGGTPGYTYQWNNGTVGALNANIPTGNYTVTITDNNQCTTTQSFVITSPSSILSNGIIGSSPLCFGDNTGSIQITPSGGVGPYNTTWNTGATGNTLSPVPAGTYTVQITDFNNCVQTDTFTITQPASLQVSTNLTQAIACFGLQQAEVIAQANGGTGNINWIWSGGQSGNVLSQAGAGTYQVWGTDQNGCVDSATVIITEPALLTSSSVSVNPVSCFGSGNGSAIVAMQGGTPSYNYQWSNGATTDNITGLNSGWYVVEVTDANNCSFIDSVWIDEPALFEIASLNTTDEICAGDANGSVSIGLTGGNLPYQIQWNTGSNAFNLTNLAPGTYIFTLDDAQNCGPITDTIVVQGGNVVNAPALNLSGNQHICNGDGFQLTASSTTPVTWSNGSTTNTIDVVSAGLYYATATDSAGCSAISDSIFVTASDIQLDINAPAFACISEPITIQVSGADFYTWNTGDIGSDIVVNIQTPTYYSVTGMDQFGCMDSAQFFLDVYDVPVALPDTLILDFETSGSVLIGTNDTAGGNFTLLNSPQNGSVTLQNGNFYYTPNNGYVGTELVYYTNCNPACLTCDTSVVYVKVNPNEDIFIPDVITPNGDDKNDFFIIKGLEDYPENSLVIMNRWGDVLFTANPYKNDWNGTSNHGITAVGGTITNSVYYYVLTLYPGAQPIKGFIEVKK